MAGIVSRVADGIDHALGNVRVLANGLVPVQVDADGLMAALENFADRMDGLGQVSCRFDCTDIVLVADNDTATHLYRIAQEAVTNALRHGNASQVVISLERDVDCIRLAVRDDGNGMDSESESGTGLRIMRFRADMIGATLSLESPSNAGLCVVCSLPGCEET